jgi:hypothetical protein
MNFMHCSAGCPLLRAGGFYCDLDILDGRLWIGKLYFLLQKISYKTFICELFSTFGHKTQDLDWIRIGIQLKMLDLDPN